MYVNDAKVYYYTKNINTELELCIDLRLYFQPGVIRIVTFHGCAGTLSFRQLEIGNSLFIVPEKKLI